MFEIEAMGAEAAGLFARLRIAEGAERSTQDWVELVGACQQVINRVSAVQTLALARVAATEERLAEDGTVVEQSFPLGHQRLDAPALVSDRLGLSDHGASTRVEHAVRLATCLSPLLRAMADGCLDTYRASVVSVELADAPDDVCRAVAATLATGLGDEPGPALRRRTRRELAAIDPDVLRVRAERHRGDRSLRRWTDRVGVDEWAATLPVEQSRQAWAAINAVAAQYLRDGSGRTIDQARADALLDLIHQQTTGTVDVQVAVPVDASGDLGQEHVATALESLGRLCDASGDRADDLVAVSGLGVTGQTCVRRGWLAFLVGATQERSRVTTTVSIVGCHVATGALLTPPLRVGSTAEGGALALRVGSTAEGGALALRVGSTAEGGALALRVGSTTEGGAPGGRRRTVSTPAYRPPDALVSLVRARDGRCRFPGCSVNARFCDLDHVRPWPTGPTRADNLACLCRRHHRIKQRPGWQVRLAPDGTMSWTDPTGGRRTTTPLDHLGATAPRPMPRLGQQVGRGVGPVADPPGRPSTRAAGSFSLWEDELAHVISRSEVERLARGLPRPATPGAVIGYDDTVCGLPVHAARARLDIVAAGAVGAWSREVAVHHLPRREPQARDDAPPF